MASPLPAGVKTTLSVCGMPGVANVSRRCGSIVVEYSQWSLVLMVICLPVAVSIGPFACGIPQAVNASGYSRAMLTVSGRLFSVQTGAYLPAAAMMAQSGCGTCTRTSYGK